MKRNEDDQPEKKENQGRSSKNQTTLTKEQVGSVVKSVVEAGLDPLSTRLGKVEAGLAKIIESLGSEGSVPAALAEIQRLTSEVNGHAKDASIHARGTQETSAQLAGKLVEMIEADETRETRMGLLITESSSKPGVDILKGDVAKLASVVAEQGEGHLTRHAEVLGRFGDLDSAVAANGSKLDGLVLQVNGVADQAAGLATQLDFVIHEGKKFKRRAFTMHEKVESVRKLIVSDGAKTRDNFADAMSASTQFLADEMAGLDTSLVDLLRKVTELPDNLGKDLAAKLVQMINLADKIANGGELIAGHMEIMGKSTSEGFRLHKHMLASIEAESRDMGNRLITDIDELTKRMASSTVETFNSIDKKLRESFEAIDPEGHLERIANVAETQKGWINQFSDIADSIIKAREDIVSKNGLLAAAHKSDFEKLLDAMSKSGTYAAELTRHFSEMASGYKNAEDAGVALNNRVIDMGIEAYRRDVERMRVEKEQARQDDREYLQSMIAPLIDEAVSKSMNGWLQGQVDTVEAEPGKQA